MGQRSQIYVRYNGEIIIANYYQWSFGDKMISRARHGIEYLIDCYLKQGYSHVFSPNGYIEKFRRYFDVNFDMKDVAVSQNIITDYQDESPDDMDFPSYCFYEQANNDGKLFIDIKQREHSKEYTLKYAFLDWNCNLDNIMTAADYMKWNHYEEYLDDKEKAICKKNLEYLSSIEVLSKDELQDFLTSQAR